MASEPQVLRLRLAQNTRQPPLRMTLHDETSDSGQGDVPMSRPVVGMTLHGGTSDSGQGNVPMQPWQTTDSLGE